MTEKTTSALIRLFFGDGDHDFCMQFDQIVELEDKLNQGPMRTLLNFQSGDWSPESVFQIIRLGLIGGGKTPQEAFTLATRYCRDRPIGETAPTAASVLSAGLMGVPMVDLLEKAEVIG